jgi:rod shape determining protein RodA
MPVTGIPLPFISYGRSSLVVSLISLGILQSIAARSNVEEPG